MFLSHTVGTFPREELLTVSQELDYTPEGLVSFLRLFRIPKALYESVTTALQKDLFSENLHNVLDFPEFFYIATNGKVEHVAGVPRFFSQDLPALLSPEHQAECVWHSYKYDKFVTRLNVSQYTHARVYLITRLFPYRHWSIYGGLHVNGLDFLCEEIITQRVRDSQEFFLSSSVLLNLAERGLQKYDDVYTAFVEQKKLAPDDFLASLKMLRDTPMSQKLRFQLEGLSDELKRRPMSMEELYNQIITVTTEYDVLSRLEKNTTSLFSWMESVVC